MSFNKQIRIMIVDDDFEIRNLLSQFLSQNGFNPIPVRNGKEMLQKINSEDPDLIILDIIMPGDDGFTLCQKIRKICQIPIIMLSAVREATDQIVGLELGADDYITKPFNPRELLARIKAILRRAKDSDREIKSLEIVKYTFSKWTLDKTSRRLFSCDNTEVNLSTGEYELLLVFVTHPLRVLNRDRLLDLAKNRPGIPFDRCIDVQISRLRQKIECDPKQPTLIKTVRGGGYMLSVPVEVNH
ncbi:MAG: response regulator [Proteobacteria bacterium]|nr:response regulator [Pseudomonadota bacterium]